MFTDDFTPYDLIVEMQQRIIQLETQHNKMAVAFHKSEHELNQCLHMLRDLQKRHINLINNIWQEQARTGRPINPHIDQEISIKK
jgi:hypothetical protein